MPRSPHCDHRPEQLCRLAILDDEHRSIVWMKGAAFAMIFPAPPRSTSGEPTTNPVGALASRAYDEGGGMTAEHQERNHGRSSDGKRRSEGKDFAATAGVGIDSLTSIRNGWGLEWQLSSTISSALAEGTANAISALAAASNGKTPRCSCIGAIDPSRKMVSETSSS